MKLMIGATDTQDIEIDAQELVTGRTCIIAQSGAGKSWGIAVLCEQLLQMNIGFCIIDTEGEYASLKMCSLQYGSVPMHNATKTSTG